MLDDLDPEPYLVIQDMEARARRRHYDESEKHEVSSIVEMPQWHDVEKANTKAEENQTPTSHDEEPVTKTGVSVLFIFGLPLHRLSSSKNVQFLVVSALALSGALAFAALQERVLYTPGFQFPGWMTMLTCLAYLFLAGLVRFVTRDFQRFGGLREYMTLSVLTLGGMYLTNWSLNYLSYPIRVVFKSSKIIPVMFMSVVYNQRQYKFSQYLGVALLSLGMIIFTLGDARGKASFDVRGLVLLLVGSMAEALAANYEERRLFNQLGCSTSEVLFYTFSITSVWNFLICCFSGELMPAVRHSMAFPQTVPIIVAAAVMGFVATTMVLTMIKEFGATVAELVKSCRKISTIAVSFVLYGKPWTLWHVAGGLLFTSSIAVERFAAGGSSRRFALMLSGTTVFSTLCLLHGHGPSTYSVVIQAGSAETVLHLFRFDAWTSQLLPIENKGQLLWEGPELSAFASDFTKLSGVLSAIVKPAVAEIPPAQLSFTPLSFYATSSFRLLPQDELNTLLADVRRLLEPHGFRDVEATLLDGQDEAKYSWLTVNFLGGAFRPGMNSLRDPFMTIDLGGGSVQSAYFVKDHVPRPKSKHAKYVKSITMPFGKGNAHLYQHSSLGSGLMQARARSMDHSDEFSDKRAHPCLPTGATISFRDKYGHRDLHVVGSSNIEKCKALAVHLLKLSGKCSKVKEHCVVGDHWGGPGHAGQKVLLSSHFFDRMRDARAFPSENRLAARTPADFASQARHVCNVGSMGIETLAAMFPHLPEDSAAWLCFDLTYESALLSEGFHLEADRPVVIAREISDDSQFDDSDRALRVDWPLGVAITKLSNELTHL
mmetsp:Transcript_723/g.1976  ORF Transcript_723/g.1976 Transcript_723/m.1976 type:complete len:828 (-) Transcript_723:135-2618(-)